MRLLEDYLFRCVCFVFFFIVSFQCQMHYSDDVVILSQIELVPSVLYILIFCTVY